MINKIVLLGRIVETPELKTTQGGNFVTSFRLAVEENFARANGDRDVDFFTIVAWRKTAEFVCKNFQKGSLIGITGKLKTRKYQTQNGETRYTTEVLAEEVSFAGVNVNQSNAQGRSTGQYAPSAPTPQNNPSAPAQNSPVPQGKSQPSHQNYAPQPQNNQQYGGYSNYSDVPDGFSEYTDDDLPF